MLVAELHAAAIRQPEVAALLADWQLQNARRLERQAGLTPAQVNMYSLLLVGLSHTDQVSGLGVSEDEVVRQVDALIDGWFAASASKPDC